MQLLEPTMQSELKRWKLPPSDPRDPVANVQAGVRYLRRLVDAFGDMNVALMAYNAGPNRIRGHLRAGEIPERFHVYPQRVNRELGRLRVALGGRPSSTSVLATADGPPRPRS
jgi:soluble lytic murein transglycosylase-like protein